MARAVTAPKPSPRLSTSNTGTRATISSCMFSSAPSVANARLTRTTMTFGRLARPTSAPTSRPSAPVASSNANAPPTKRIVRITSAPATMPRGTVMSAGISPSGAGSTRAYVPATTTERPLEGSSRRSYRPAGITHVSATATATQPRRRTRGWGRRGIGFSGSRVLGCSGAQVLRCSRTREPEHLRTRAPENLISTLRCRSW